MAKTLGHVGLGTGEVEPFNMVFENGLLVTPQEISDGVPIDALVIWGGEDISPSLYGDTVSRFTGARDSLSYRDRVESQAVMAAQERSIPIIGVCRGAQLLCAVAGGRLIQHVENHGWSHHISTFDNKKVVTSSCHHQMMFPFGVDHKIIAWSSKNISPCYINGSNLNDPEMEGQVEPEIVWFPKIKGLAIQGHPEFHSDPENDPFVLYCMDLVRMFITEEN